MTKKTFDQIAEGLTEALAFSRGQPTQARLHVPPEVDVRAVRAKTGLSQETFASSFGFNVAQVRQWEQGRYRPTGAMRAYLMAIERDHTVVLGLLADAGSSSAAAVAPMKSNSLLRHVRSLQRGQ